MSDSLSDGGTPISDGTPPAARADLLEISTEEESPERRPTPTPQARFVLAGSISSSKAAATATPARELWRPTAARVGETPDGAAPETPFSADALEADETPAADAAETPAASEMPAVAETPAVVLETPAPDSDDEADAADERLRVPARQLKRRCVRRETSLALRVLATSVER